MKDADADKLVKDLRNENLALRKRNNALAEKLRSLVDEMKRRKPTSRPSRPSSAARARTSLAHDRPSPRHSSTPDQEIRHDPSLQRLVAALKSRLHASEERMAQIQAENARLKSAPQPEPHRRSPSPTAGSSSAAVRELDRQLRDKSAQLMLLKVRF